MQGSIRVQSSVIESLEPPGRSSTTLIGVGLSAADIAVVSDW